MKEKRITEKVTLDKTKLEQLEKSFEELVAELNRFFDKAVTTMDSMKSTADLKKKTS